MTIKAVLLDLDNTLLQNPDRNFAFKYLHAVDKFFEDECQIQGASASFIRVLQELAKPRANGQTNTEIALQVIGDGLSRSVGDIAQLMDKFYDEVYPALKSITEPIAFSTDVIEFLRQGQYQVVIATNPIYPAKAVFHRLHWAGIDHMVEEFSLVTTGDNMHFIKPNTGYYEEILRYLGVEASEVVMVGDSIVNDIEPASSLGIHTFHIRDQHDSDVTRPNGTLKDFYSLIADDNWLVGIG